ncbi:hypothetical protein Tco_1192457 [Tanacetum coccineum]
MESTNIVSSCLDSKEREMQRMQVKARITKESCMNGFRALHSNFKIHSKVDLLGTPSESGFKRVFRDFFGEEDRTFKDAFFHNMDKIEKLIHKENLYDNYVKNAHRVLKKPFEKFFHSRFLKYSNYDALHERDINQRLKDRKLQTQEGQVNKVKALNANLVVTKSIYNGDTISVQQDGSSMMDARLVIVGLSTLFVQIIDLGYTVLSHADTTSLSPKSGGFYFICGHYY